MNFNPFGLRAMKRGLKAHTVLDGIARHFAPTPMPFRSERGKLRKDDSSSKSVRDYLAEKQVYRQIHPRKAPYEPNQMARNFWK